MYTTAGFTLGLCVAPVFWPLVLAALLSAMEVRFRLGAQWRYSRLLPRSARPPLWRWPLGAVRMWWTSFGREDETTGLTFKGGVEFRRGRFGRAERVR